MANRSNYYPRTPQLQSWEVQLEEDLIELVSQREDIKDRIENTKYKKMTFSKDEEANSYILNLEDCQISFDIIEGEDEEGPWFEVECNIIFF